MSEEQRAAPTNKNGVNWGYSAALCGLMAPIGYAAAYLREWGYCGVYGIPLEFIQLNLTTVLIAIAGSIGILYILFQIINLFYSLASGGTFKNLTLLQLNIIIVIFISIILLAFVAVFRSLIELWPLLVVIVFYVIFFQLIFPLLTQRKTKGYENKIAAQMVIDNQYKSVLNFFGEKFGATTAWIILGIFGFLFIMYFSGYDAAKTQKDYFIPSTNQNSVVLRIYGDNLICAPFDIKTKKVEKAFFIFKISDGYNPQLKLTTVGPLIPSDVLSPDTTTK